MKIPGLSSSFVREHAAEGSYERGLNYHRSGAVVSLKRTSDATVDALVKGSQYAPYSVRIRHDSKHVSSVECSCPYFAGAWCKHVVATLLACLHEATEEWSALPPSQTIAHLGAEEIDRLLDAVAVRHPEFAVWIREEMRGL